MSFQPCIAVSNFLTNVPVHAFQFGIWMIWICSMEVHHSFIYPLIVVFLFLVDFFALFSWNQYDLFGGYCLFMYVLLLVILTCVLIASIIRCWSHAIDRIWGPNKISAASPYFSSTQVELEWNEFVLKCALFLFQVNRPRTSQKLSYILLRGL